MSARVGSLFLSLMAILACASDPRAASTSPAQSGVARLAAADPTVTWDLATRLVGDVDGDGIADSAFVGRAAAAVHIGLLRATGDSAEVLAFPVANAQQAVCARTAVLTFESMDYDPSDAVGKIVGFQRSPTSRGLRLDDGNCDPIHLFWNVSSHHLDWWRA